MPLMSPKHTDYLKRIGVPAVGGVLPERRTPAPPLWKTVSRWVLQLLF